MADTMNQLERMASVYVNALTMSSNKDILKCECGCTWLYPIQVNQYTTDPVAVGQQPNPVDLEPVTVLICAKCGKPVKHNVINNGFYRRGGNKRSIVLKEISALPEDAKKENRIDIQNTTTQEKAEEAGKAQGIQDSGEEDISSAGNKQ